MEPNDNIQALRHDFANWTTLKAWETYLGQVELVLKSARKPSQSYSTGYSRGGYRIYITVGSNLNYARATLLHELAHAALQKRGICDGHGKLWRQTFMDAAAEVLGLWDFEEKSNLRLTSAVGMVFDMVEYQREEKGF